MKKIITLIILSLLIVSCWEETGDMEKINDIEINTVEIQEENNTITDNENIEEVLPELIDRERFEWPGWIWWSRDKFR